MAGLPNGQGVAWGWNGLAGLIVDNGPPSQPFSPFPPRPPPPPAPPPPAHDVFFLLQVGMFQGGLTPMGGILK